MARSISQAPVEKPAKFSKKAKGNRKAVIVVHGMGQQMPFETLDSVMWSIVGDRPDNEFNCSVQFLRTSDETHEGRSMPKLRLKLPSKKESTSPAPPVDVDLFEVYWSPLTELGIKPSTVYSFLLRSGSRGLRKILPNFLGAQGLADQQKRVINKLKITWGNIAKLLLALAFVSSLAVLSFIPVITLATLIYAKIGNSTAGIKRFANDCFTVAAFSPTNIILVLLLSIPLVLLRKTRRFRKAFAWFASVLSGITVFWVIAVPIFLLLLWTQTPNRYNEAGYKAAYKFLPKYLLPFQSVKSLNLENPSSPPPASVIAPAAAPATAENTPAANATAPPPLKPAGQTDPQTDNNKNKDQDAGIDVEFSPYFLWHVIGTCLSILVVVRINKALVTHIGDLVAYISWHEVSIFEESREKIRARASAVFRQVFSGRGINAYDEVIVVAHSLGSVIAYDCLNRLINDAEIDNSLSGEMEGPSGGEEIAQRLKFLTVGSPLDKIAALFATGANNSFDSARDLLSKSLQPMLTTPGFRPKEWVNIYSKKDPVGASLDLYNIDPDTVPPGQDLKNVKNLVDEDGDWPLFAHVQYFDNRIVHEELCKLIGIPPHWDASAHPC